MAQKNKSQLVEVDGCTVRLTNLTKVLWPEDGLTKKDLIWYYTQIADTILAHLRQRPLTVVRCPDGIAGKSFYQKNVPSHTPDFVNTAVVGEGKEAITYIVPTNRATLIWLANQAALELHPWLSTLKNPLHPDVIVFDLDPAEGSTFEDAREIALILKTALDELGVRGYPKLSGATGIHIYVPVIPKYSYQVTSRFVGFLGELMVKLYPRKVTNERLVKKRTGKVYIDHLQNLYGKTIVSAYSPRPLPGAPVSVPVTWEELESVKPDQFTITSVPQRLEKVGDLFAPVLTDRQSLDQLLPELGLGE